MWLLWDVTATYERGLPQKSENMCCRARARGFRRRDRTYAEGPQCAMRASASRAEDQDAPDKGRALHVSQVDFEPRVRLVESCR
jgi:hypothetical protein